MTKMIFSALAIIFLQACTVTKTQQLVNYAGEHSECRSIVKGLLSFDPGAHIIANRNLKIVCDARAKNGWLPAADAGTVGITVRQAGNQVTVYSVEANTKDIQVQDVILKVDGEVLNSPREAKKRLFGKLGSQVTILVLRDKYEIEIAATRTE